MNTLTLNKKAILYKSLLAVIAVGAAIALPQIFHLIGRATGLNSTLGEIFLPMHLPVLLAAIFGGPVVGTVVGAVSPLLSHAISGMPGVAALPFMVIELAAYGLSLGLLSKTKMPVVAKVLIAQIAGRAFRALATVIAIFGFNYTLLPLSGIWNGIITGIPGIVLQLAIIPLAVYVASRRKDGRA